MSAYIVEDRTINVIVSHLHLNRDFEWLRAEFCEVVKPMSKGVDAEIGRALHAMNCAALAARYGDKEFPRYQFKLEPASPRQVYAAVKCLQYQACESAIPETALYKLLVAFRSAVADEIIESLPEEPEPEPEPRKNHWDVITQTLSGNVVWRRYRDRKIVTAGPDEDPDDALARIEQEDAARSRQN